MLVLNGWLSTSTAYAIEVHCQCVNYCTRPREFGRLVSKRKKGQFRCHEVYIRPRRNALDAFKVASSNADLIGLTAARLFYGCVSMELFWKSPIAYKMRHFFAAAENVVVGIALNAMYGDVLWSCQAPIFDLKKPDSTKDTKYRSPAIVVLSLPVAVLTSPE